VAGPALAKKPVVVQQARAQAQRSMAVQASRAGGGHLHKHVGQHNTYLQARASSSLARANFTAASLGANLSRAPTSKHVPKPQPSAKRTKAVKYLNRMKTRSNFYSSFTNGQHADHWYGQVQRLRSREIRSWLATARPGDRFQAKFNARQTIGTTYNDRTRKFTPATKGNFVLVRTKSGFYPLTATLS